MILLDSMITTTNDSGESSQVKMFLALYDNSGAASADKGLLTVDRLIASEETSKGLMYEGYNLQFAKLKEFPNPMFLLAYLLTSQRLILTLYFQLYSSSLMAAKRYLTA